MCRSPCFPFFLAFSSHILYFERRRAEISEAVDRGEVYTEYAMKKLKRWETRASLKDPVDREQQESIMKWIGKNLVNHSDALSVKSKDTTDVPVLNVHLLLQDTNFRMYYRIL